MNILFLVPSKLDGPSARYVIDLVDVLFDHQVNGIISSEDEDQSFSRDKNHSILNIKMPILGNLNSFNDYLNKIKKLNIDIVFAIGSRVKIDIIALSLKKLGATYIKQFEDDEETIFLNCNKNAKHTDYTTLLNKGVKDNFKAIDLHLLAETKFKIIDPYIKGLTLSALDAYSKIWGGLNFDEEKYLKNLNSFSLPPICSAREVKALRKELHENKLVKESFTYFIGGSIYSQKDADIFISAWVDFKKTAPDAKLIISYSRTSKVVIKYLVDHFHGTNGVEIIDLPSDEEYSKVFTKSNYILSIGGGQFDEKRLPSRLVKSMHLGKKILTPLVGFGNALVHKENAYICKGNTKKDWLDTLNTSYHDSDSNSVNKNVLFFAKENFDADGVSVKFSDFVSNVFNNKKSLPVPKLSEQLASSMLADFIGLNNSPDKGKNRPAIKRIRYRLIRAGNSLFVQTLDRSDYNFQVECSAQALIGDKANLILNDTGFLFIKRNGVHKHFGISLNPTISGTELVELIKAFRGLFTSLAPEGRSAILDKAVLAYRLYKLISDLQKQLGIQSVFFHADMQPVEAMISSLINSSLENVITISLQHALFYQTNDDKDVNIVNTRISPSQYTFFWDDYVAKLVCQYNPKKVREFTDSMPSLLLKDLNSSANENKSLLVVLDGPNHKLFNTTLLKMCDRLLKEKFISEYDIKPHPNHSVKDLDAMVASGNCNIIKSITCHYQHTVFISSTLGIELYNAGFSTFQFMPKSFSDFKLTFTNSNIQKFTSFEFLANTIKKGDFVGYRIIPFSFEKKVLTYQNSFKKAVARLSK